MPNELADSQLYSTVIKCLAKWHGGSCSFEYCDLQQREVIYVGIKKDDMSLLLLVLFLVNVPLVFFFHRIKPGYEREASPGSDAAGWRNSTAH